MQMSGEQTVAAPREKVWQALNDPAILAQCLPGCEKLDRDGDNGFSGIAEVKIGPIGARFKGQVQLSDLNPPASCTMTGSGNAGIAGTAKGTARVRLSDAPGGGTLISYEVDADLGGRMAQLGGAIVDATARNLAAKFFARFAQAVRPDGDTGHAGVRGAGPASSARGESAHGVGPTTEAFPADRPLSDRPARGGIWGWVAVLVLTLLTGFALGAHHAPRLMVLVLVLLIVVAVAAFEFGRRH